jgi:hypothetical protein
MTKIVQVRSHIDQHQGEKEMTAEQRTAGVVGRLVVLALFLAIAITARAQVQTTTSTAPTGAPTTTVKVERGTVVAVSGNNLIVKADDGSIRDFNNVPDTTTVTVDGKQLNVHQLTPGMTIERQTVTTASPRMVTTVKTVTGKVWHVTPPNSVILTLEDGKNQSFKIPKGQKFTINGQEMDAFGLRKGMTVTAQQVTEEPEVVYAREVKRTGSAPPPPPAPQANVPILVVFVPIAAPAPAADAPAEPAPAALPKTASDLPLLGLLGAFFVALGLGLKSVRAIRA